MLRNSVYPGHTVNFKTCRHFKDKKSDFIGPEEWTGIPNGRPVAREYSIYRKAAILTMKGSRLSCVKLQATAV